VSGDFIHVKPGVDKSGAPVVQAQVTTPDGITTLTFTVNEAIQFADILKEGVKRAVAGARRSSHE
jgi:pyrroline-5-carboxylate reductase